MNKKLLITSGIMLSGLMFSQKNFWTQIQNTNTLGKAPLKEVKVMPTDYKLYSLNVQGLKSELSKTPSRESNDESLVLKFPTATGKLVDYIVKEASVMEPALQAKFADIRSYVGYEKGNSSNTIRFSTTPYEGVNIMYFDGWDVSYMDAYTNDLSSYMVYKRSALPANPETFNCDFEKVNFSQGQDYGNDIVMKDMLVKDGQFRTYRLALACTIEYAAYHINRAGLSAGTTEQKKAAIMTEMAVAMTRVNGVYEKTISSTMLLVANNDQLIFIDSDNYTNNSGSAMLSENQTVCNAVIGTENYDIGHVFSTGGGGVAYLRSVCTTNTKAGGVTGLTAPVNDAFYIDYVAHEIGHQFGGNHTFRANTGSCSGNANTTTAMEPGSGSTIMAYAGICGTANNVQAHSDPYFHSASVNEMYSWVSRAADCSSKVSNGNSVPTADAGADYTIPFGTAFVLTGAGTDPDGDALTYLWEQTDYTSNTQPPVATATGGPVFRSYTPTTSNQRYVPLFSSVLNNILTPKWEVIPSVARTLNFSLLVNDNKVTGNQAARDVMRVTVAATGPFKVTSHTSNIEYNGGEATTVTWDVAGTDASPINTSTVQILLSKDAGATFTLLAEVPNTGSASVTLPNQTVASARLMIKAVNNIYYAVNSSAFKIKEVLAVNEAALEKGFAIYPNPAKGEVNISLNKSVKGATYQIVDLSGKLISNGIMTNEKTKINISHLKTGTYRIRISNNGETMSKNLIVR